MDSVNEAMQADLDTYIELEALYCKCETLCTCDDALWLAIAAA